MMNSGFEIVVPASSDREPSLKMINKPFLHISNHCIPLSRIIAINFIPNGLVSKVGDNIFFHEDIAEQDADMRGLEVENLTVPIIIVEYMNKEGVNDYIRRFGHEAVVLWNYVVHNLSAP